MHAPEPSGATLPTWRKYIVIAHHVDTLRVRDKRAIFQLMRLHPDMTANSFLPEFGITAGDFATWYVLRDTRRRDPANEEE